MKIYIAREAGTTKIHGIFWARSMAELWDAIDEMSDPSDFEVAEIGHAGGIWHDVPIPDTPKTAQLDESDVTDDQYAEELFQPFGNCSDMLAGDLFHQNSLKWRRMDYINEGVGFLARLKRQEI